MTLNVPSTLIKVSPSQINTWNECNRKWGWDKIGGFRTPSTKAQQFGTDTHQELENYYVHQRLPSLSAPGRLASKGLHLIPQMTDPSAKCEGKFFFDLDGITYNGIKDLFYRDAKEPLDVIHDHKTTSSDRYIKTPEALRQDPQAIMYAQDYFLKHPAANHVIMRWLYLFTRGTKPPLLVEVIFNRVFVQDQFNALIVPPAQAIAQARRTITNPLDLPYDVKACSNYGGCPYQDKCGLTAHERAMAIMTDTPLSPAALLASLNAGNAPVPSPILGLSVPAPVVAPPPEVAVNPPVIEAPPNAVMAALMPPAAVEVEPAPVPPPPPPAEPPYPAPRAEYAPPIPSPEVEAAVSVMPPIETTDEQPKPKRRGRPATRKTMILYVDCAPLKKGCSAIADILPRPYDEDVFRAKLEADNIGGSYYLDSKTRQREALDVLMSYASEVVKATV